MQRIVYLIGMGCGSLDQITGEAIAALQQSDIYLGSKRLLDLLPEYYCGIRIPSVTVSEQLDLILRQKDTICVLFSGDTGFFSGAKGLSEALYRHHIPYVIYPGISCIQVLSAKLGKPWQDWILASAHGRPVDILSLISKGKMVCLLTDHLSGNPKDICQKLVDADLGDLSVTIAESLSCIDESIFTGPAKQFVHQSFGALSLMLIEAPQRSNVTVPGIPDDLFLRGKIPMTKQEIRCLIPSKLALKCDDICWDIGAGTGSISIELALQCRQVWAVERSAEAMDLIKQNRMKFCAWNLRTVHGTAPEALDNLPTPDAVVIGGSAGYLHDIFRLLYARNPKVRLCVTAISLETLHSAVDAFCSFNIEPDISQISASHVFLTGEHHIIKAQNPVFLISDTLS